MNIAFITPEYPHLKVANSAGIGTSTKNLVDELVKKGVFVTVFVYQQNTSEVIKEGNLTIHLISQKPYNFLGWYLYRKHLQKYINSVVSKENISLIEAPDWTGITAFMQFKVPLVIRFHGTDAYFCKLENRKQKFKNFVFERLALKKASGFISPSLFTKTKTAELLGLQLEKIKIIPNGVNLEKFQNESPNSFEDKTILYFGTIIRKKGVLELAKIFNKVLESVPDAKLILIGSDSYDVKTNSISTFKLMQELLTDKANANTTYLGKLPYFKISNYIKKVHVCVFPSFAETFGMVTVESMAMQKPVVNTNIGWANEIIDDGINGYLVSPTETDIYAERIIKLFKDKTLSMDLGKAARQKVEANFDITTIADDTVTYYQTMISRTNYR